MVIGSCSSILLFSKFHREISPKKRELFVDFSPITCALDPHHDDPDPPLSTHFLLLINFFLFRLTDLSE
ncbi:hypothetical protein L2E82_02625 [Cichorium intybus]|uniref:Uncharacterized protein n=1 Tax=Cichorium intybus TaxID=13427 RepID=A0ACB9H3G1_CICIN|nr:hypothetical protein L2E82_02625 [Cichorium intybus]